MMGGLIVSPGSGNLQARGARGRKAQDLNEPACSVLCCCGKMATEPRRVQAKSSHTQHPQRLTHLQVAYWGTGQVTDRAARGVSAHLQICLDHASGEPTLQSKVCVRVHTNKQYPTPSASCRLETLMQSAHPRWVLRPTSTLQHASLINRLGMTRAQQTKHINRSGVTRAQQTKHINRSGMTRAQQTKHINRSGMTRAQQTKLLALVKCSYPGKAAKVIITRAAAPLTAGQGSLHIECTLAARART